MENTRHHECEALKKIDDISVQRIRGNWCWVFWGTKKGNPTAHGIGYCPYCGTNLYEELKEEKL